MARDKRYDILFEPVQIGPVRAPNRFYQVPHCTGLGYAYPAAQAGLRAMKAEGGWGVVSTQLCEIAPSSELIHPYDRLWDDDDIPVHARMVEGVHAHGSLAAVQLGHIGIGGKNYLGRMPAIGPGSLRNSLAQFPAQSRAMDKADIGAFRELHRAAVRRAKQAGFDIIYVYAAHNASIASHFLARRYNTRTDEYGGSLENRARLLRELLEDTREIAGGDCAVAIRFAVDEQLGDAGMSWDREGREVVEMLAELPDLWDVNVSNWSNDSMTSRFAEEGFQEEYVAFVKRVTSKPVVGVGRFTSPDAMVSQIRRGILDLIGAARPSIADPFLPRKIEEGRPEDIRECIGCNVCVSAERYGAPIHCTQNPTMGEEWKRGWHPERVPPRGSEKRFLVVGAGPAGLECALSLGRRGYDVALAEADRALGGRVLKESKLPGLATWIRVRDYRVHEIGKLSNVEIYRESKLGPNEILDLGFDQIVLATGATWRRDGVGGTGYFPIPGIADAPVFTADDIHAGAELPSPVLVYDDDHYYLGATICEMLQRRGKQTIYVTPAIEVSSWTGFTMEQKRIQGSLMRAGVQIRTAKELVSVAAGEASLACIYTGDVERVPFGSILLLTSQLPEDRLYHALLARSAEFADRGIAAIHRIGDCLAPATIAAAVFSGHELAVTVDRPSNAAMPFMRERIHLTS
jgi:dimethylamine/trimethylamine dehydrogenase